MNAVVENTEKKTRAKGPKHSVKIDAANGSILVAGTVYSASNTSALAAFALRILAKRALHETPVEDKDGIAARMVEVISAVNDGSFLKKATNTTGRFLSVFSAITGKSLEDATAIYESKRALLHGKSTDKGADAFEAWEGQVRRLEEFKTEFAKQYPRKEKVKSGPRVTLANLI